MQQVEKISLRGWISWLLGASFFFIMYIGRLSPGVMTSELMLDFHVSTAALGYLSMYFFYPYVLLQLPAGILVDRFGPKRLLILMSVVCGLACYLFSQADSYNAAIISRLLFGIGASFAFVCSLKIAILWFPASRIGFVAGLTQSLGMVGAAVGEQPIAHVVQWTGWRNTLLLEMGLFILLASLVILFVKERAASHVAARTSGADLRKGLRLVLLNPQTWLVGLYAGFLFAPTAAFAELWGNSFLRVGYELSSEKAAFCVGLVFIGFAISGPILGWLSDRTGRRKPWLWLSSIMSAILLLTVVYVPNLSFTTLSILMLIYGLFNTGVVVAYAVASEINPSYVSGISLGIANMLSIIIGALSQPLIGELLERISQQFDPLNYSLSDYQEAFLAIPISFAISLIILIFVKETQCKSTPD